MTTDSGVIKMERMWHNQKYAKFGMIKNKIRECTVEEGQGDNKGVM